MQLVNAVQGRFKGAVQGTRFKGRGLQAPNLLDCLAAQFAGKKRVPPAGETVHHNREASVGVEPTMADLQSAALATWLRRLLKPLSASRC